MANRINYNQAITQANNIKGLSTELNNEIASLESLLARVKSEWKGPASDEFQRRLQMMITDMKITRDDMSSVSSSIKAEATVIQQEDDRINAIAETLRSW